MTDAVNTDNLALLVNTPAEAESQLRNLEHAAGFIGFTGNANKTEYMYFKQKGAISTENGKPRKLFDQFTYNGSKIMVRKISISSISV